MGNGPGDIFAYWEAIERNPHICGAFTWQLWDHAILDKDGKLKYGGDFNEKISDGHFNIDGVFFVSIHRYREIKSRRTVGL